MRTRARFEVRPGQREISAVPIRMTLALQSTELQPMYHSEVVQMLNHVVESCCNTNGVKL